LTLITADLSPLRSSLEEYVEHVSAFPVYGPEEERELFRAARGGDAAALDAVVAAHLRVVVDLALERRGWGVPLVDLIHAGNQGLEKAARRHDPGVQGRFRPFAAWWIRAEMKQALEVA
jgi:DNA-directed RNA polymerase sigma subunit (sigma70/sigma32)